ncbi:hypothetical protein AOQ84DRAFT_369172 [Glonium stellatum]|uniref:Uncharacterized protein n=1 Tax=Glonium stellatum TaxID=574774 RepID=A0A8E2EPI2_9PEZI|nr:hypothetical protein AOQ84DRAFT_369172 [Glonium stellatum]
MNPAPSLMEPFVESGLCCCEQYQNYLYTQWLEEQLARERTNIKCLQDERLQIQSEFKDFRAQTQHKTDRIEKRVDSYKEYLKRTVAATERLEQALKQITIAQEHGKEDDALRALLALKSSVPKTIDPSWVTEQKAFDRNLEYQKREELLPFEMERLVNPSMFSDE